MCSRVVIYCALPILLLFPFLSFAQTGGASLSNLPSPEALQQCLKDKGITGLATPEQLQNCITSLGGILTAPSGVTAPARTSTPTAQAPTSPAPTGSCPNLIRTLSKGSKGTDVTQLQTFLISQKDLAAGNNTGYFGALTEAAVKSFQKRNDVVSSGTPATTGYGTVGAKTRAAIAKVCANPGTVSANASANAYSQGAYGAGYSQGGNYSQGSYANASAQSKTSSQNTGSACSIDGKTMQSGQSAFFYTNSSLYSQDAPVLCSTIAQSRTCTNGTLSGSSSYKYAACADYSSFQKLSHGELYVSYAPGSASVTAYFSSSPCTTVRLEWGDGTTYIKEATKSPTQCSQSDVVTDQTTHTYSSSVTYATNIRRVESTYSNIWYVPKKKVSVPISIGGTVGSVVTVGSDGSNKVQAAPAALTVTAYPNAGTVSVEFKNAPGNPTDWIGIYDPVNQNYLDWVYTSGTKTAGAGWTSGSVAINANFVSGRTYYAYFHINGGSAGAAYDEFTGVAGSSGGSSSTGSSSGCKAPRHYTYNLTSEKPLACGYASTPIFSVTVPDTGKALARASISYRNDGGQVYSWSALTRVGDGEINLGHGDDICPAVTTAKKDSLGYGTLSASSQTVTVSGYLDVCGAPVTAVSGTLDVWVEDPAPECKGKDIGLAYTYPQYNNSPYYWSSNMTEAMNISIPQSSNRSKLMVFGTNEGNAAQSPNNSCSNINSSATLLAQAVTDAHGELARHEDAVTVSLGMGHVVLSMFGQTFSSVNAPTVLRMLVGKNVGTSVYTGGCCGGAMIGFVRE